MRAETDDTLHDPLRALMLKALTAARGDETAAREMFGMFIRMNDETLTAFHHILEAYAVDRLIDEVRDLARPQ